MDNFAMRRILSSDYATVERRRRSLSVRHWLNAFVSWYCYVCCIGEPVINAQRDSIKTKRQVEMTLLRVLLPLLPCSRWQCGCGECGRYPSCSSSLRYSCPRLCAIRFKTSPG